MPSDHLAFIGLERYLGPAIEPYYARGRSSYGEIRVVVIVVARKMQLWAHSSRATGAAWAVLVYIPDINRVQSLR